jgi:hypothetical protein
MTGDGSPHLFLRGEEAKEKLQNYLRWYWRKREKKS